jgi:phosphonopyruvate decarboxylase
MIAPDVFFSALVEAEVGFFTGVPDSLLKSFCAFVTANTEASNHVIAANEGAAVGLAMGYHLATGKLPLVYLQNSGLGNTINPLTSLVDPDVYSIPMLLLVECMQNEILVRTSGLQSLFIAFCWSIFVLCSFRVQ